MLKKFVVAFVIIVSFSSLFANMGDKVEAAYYHTKAVSVAKSNIGVPYQWGGMSPSGFDCSGLIKYSYARAGKTLNRTAAQMFYGNGYRIYNYIQPGDLMFYAPTKASSPTHVAMYIGNGKMIMASSSKGVMITSTNNPYWHPRYVGTKRV
ncbi:cell wall-associated NlpC family hydrolase [Neobacillus niacini]|uniref:C40 family peptidase n=1 Tax=Neobacillus niacini TaxID=86668 RepID=UPI00285E24EF|nr:C40 family peptidase [Neobacillus niacini]MDR7079373.1 cell wall-associated NlpC family hydrolase [Neobacillus niacini]